MKVLASMRKWLTVGLTVQLVIATQWSTMARAEMISTETAIERYAGQADRAFLLGEIQRQEIRGEIIALGVDPAEAEARLEALSDAEIASILAQMDENSAGAGAGGIVGALLTVFIILLVTDLLCLTKVFNFTRCAR